MRAAGPSFLNLQLRPQEAMRQNQRALSEAQTELSTQRWHDVPLTLARDTGRNIQWHAEVSATEAVLKAFDLTALRADIGQSSLATVSKLATDLVSQLIASRSAQNGQQVARTQAEHALQTLRDAMNVEVSGVHVFAGRNQGTPPLPNYEGSAGEAQVNASFGTAFGFAVGDPALQDVTAAQAKAWLDGDFAAQFGPTNWQATFSDASSDTMSVRVGINQRVNLPATANDDSIRNVYAAIVSVVTLSTGQLNDGAFKALVDDAAAKLSSAVQGLGDMQAELGISQKALQNAKEQMTMRKTWLNSAIQMSESVDPYEVATRVNGLMNQLEASYSVTGRISRLSLLNYL
jgi:flagellar hook-associated protein 3 FlgL